MVDPRSYSSGTRAALAALSQGTCYYPGCQTKLVVVREDGDAYIEYKIAHIYDAKPGNRYKAEMTDDERRAFGNLILLCQSHHEEVDTRHPERFAAEKLLEWKNRKERVDGSLLSHVGSITDAELAATLASAAIRITNSVVNLGAQGGQAPGAGGAGGTAIGPGAVGGRGGDGGDHVTAHLRVEAGQVFEIEVGEGGSDGQPGGDTVLRAVWEDGIKTEVVRARGGGRQRFNPRSVPFRLTSALLANAAEIHDGLVYMIGAGWDQYQVVTLPERLGVALVLVLEPAQEHSGGADVMVEFADPDGTVVDSGTLWVQFESEASPLRLSRIFYLTAELGSLGIWKLIVSCNGEVIESIPLAVVQKM